MEIMGRMAQDQENLYDPTLRREERRTHIGPSPCRPHVRRI